ncbi:MAG: SRPBCC family protein [Nitrospirota bacterium]
MRSAQVVSKRTREMNVEARERWISMISGSLLALYGMTNHSRRGRAMALAGSYLVYRGKTGYCPVYHALGIHAAGIGLRERIKIEESITVDRPREEVYRFWRNFENLPLFMEHLAAVRSSNSRSHWVAKEAPGGLRIEWDTEITEERENEVIKWRTPENADIRHKGSVRFKDAPGNRGTEVTLKMRYYPPAGKAGVAVAKLLKGITGRQVEEELRHFKQIMETDGVPNPAS